MGGGGTMATLTCIGGGSYGWMPSLLARMLSTASFHGDRLVLMDIHPEPLEDIHRLALALKERLRSPIAISATTDLSRALDGADYVSLTIATGGLEAMAADLEVPERYGIHQTVGDTVGPGGLSRALRNVPVVVAIAREMERRCPRAWLLNLSNPLSTLTRAVTRETSIRCAGLCQGVVEHVQWLTRLLGEQPDQDVQFVTAGIDHCPWLLDLRIRGRDGFAMLAERGLRSPDVAAESAADSRDAHVDVPVGKRAGFALWHAIGHLPGIGDRHLVENFGQFTADPALLARFGIQRTTIAMREETLRRSREHCRRLIADPGPLLGGGTHAPLMQVIDALEGRGDLLTTLNVENAGQIPELPARANVETLCRVDRLGVHPLALNRPLPRALEAIVRPHVMRQEGAIEAALTGDFELALGLLATDPQLRDPGHARPMLAEMIERNRRWLPAFAPKAVAARGAA
jgi:alpha-galactosidase